MSSIAGNIQFYYIPQH